MERRRLWSLAGAALTATLVAAACGTNRDLIDTGSATPAATAPRAAATQSATSTPAPTPPPRPSPAPTPLPLPLTPIVGLFSDARPTVISERIDLPELPLPAIQLDPITRIDDTLLFDLEQQTVTQLGPGFRGSFSPDGTRMTWVRITSQTAGEVRLIDLASGDHRRIGAGLDSAPWVDDDTVLSVNATARVQTAIDVDTANTRPAPVFDPPTEPFVSELRGDLRLVQISDGLPAAFEVRELVGGKVLLRLEAEAASFAADRELVIATPATAPDLSSNIFLVDVDTASATFVASTALTTRPLLALSANDRSIAWSERFCSPDTTTRVFDRLSSEVREYVGAGWAVLTPSGQLAIGEFGAGPVRPRHGALYLRAPQPPERGARVARLPLRQRRRGTGAREPLRLTLSPDKRPPAWSSIISAQRIDRVQRHPALRIIANLSRHFCAADGRAALSIASMQRAVATEG